LFLSPAPARLNLFKESHAAGLFRDALALPPEARSALIDSLIESLHATVDEGATEAWKREIELRLKQIDDGTVELISWSAARRRVFATGWSR
jgi:putative addiction module component (TIGR02574 family)